jgi:hypothetical protein
MNPLDKKNESDMPTYPENLTPDDPINPLNKKIELYMPTYPEDLLANDEIIVFEHRFTDTTAEYQIPVSPPYTNKTLPLEADIILYGTLKSIQPSIWSTANQNPPPGLSDIQPIKVIAGYENGTIIKYNIVSIPECNDYIHTPVTFEVNNLIKGENATEVTVILSSGQVGNYITMITPLIWNLEVDQEYLVYLKKDSKGNNTIMHNYVTENGKWTSGFFIVVE